MSSQNEETRRLGDYLVGRKVKRHSDGMIGMVVSVDFYDPRDGNDITVVWADGTREKTGDNHSGHSYISPDSTGGRG